MLMFDSCGVPAQPRLPARPVPTIGCAGSMSAQSEPVSAGLRHA